MELSREDLTEAEARLVDKLNRRRALIELAHREWDAEQAKNSSLGCSYPIGVIARALEGTSDFEKFKGAPSAVPCRFTFAELIAAGISDKGLARVIVQADAPGSSDSCKPCWCKRSGLCLVVSQEEFEEFQDSLEKRGGNNA